MNTCDSSKIKNVALLTSGGDAPGMNAAIRAVVRYSIHNGLGVFGVHRGYKGLISGEIDPLTARSVANIIQRGGTILKTDRCLEFLKPEVRALAASTMSRLGIDALITIGGDGTFTGAQILGKEHNIPIVGIPGTIDNDIAGTEYTIGFDTAVNTAVEAIDKIRDTAHSHDRLFIVEVMGRNSGFLAADVGLAVGAEEVFTPENPISVEQAIEGIKASEGRGKKSSILITAEGQKPGRAYDLAENIRKKSGFEAKVCILGHIQRGGCPSAFDRTLASRMGAAAVDSLLQGNCGHYMAIENNKLVRQSLDLVVTKKKALDTSILKLCQALS